MRILNLLQASTNIRPIIIFKLSHATIKEKKPSNQRKNVNHIFDLQRFETSN